MKKIFTLLRSAAVPAFMLWAGCALSAEADLVFEEAWVRPMPPGMQMTAGFGQLRNVGSEQIEIVDFASPQFSDVSLHRTELRDGVSRMREVPSLSVAPATAIELAPGGYHLMLMGPLAPLAADQVVTVEVTAGDGRVFHFEIPVERR